MSEPIILTLPAKEGEEPKVLKVGHFTQSVKAKFVAYLKGLHLAAITSQRDELDAKMAYNETLDNYVFECANGKFEFYGKKWWAYVMEPAHYAELVWLLLNTQQGIPRPKVQELLREFPAEFTVVWKQLLEEDMSGKA